MKKFLTLFLFSLFSYILAITLLLFPADSIALPKESSVPQVKTNTRLSRTDSLLQVLKTSKEDTNKVNILNLLSKQYSNLGSYEPAMQYAQQALKQSERIIYKKGISTAYNNIGVIYWSKGNYEVALDIFSKSLKINQEINNKKGIAVCFNNIGLVFLNQGNYEMALNNFLKSLKIKEEIKDIPGIGMSYLNIGNIYLNKGTYDKALDFFSKSLKINIETGNKTYEATNLNNIGIVYVYQGNSEKALDNYLKSLKIMEEIKDKNGVAMCYSNIGHIYYEQGNYKKALETQLKSAKINIEIGNKQGVAVSYTNIGNIYMKLKKYDDANHYISQSLSILKSIGFKDGIKDAYSSLSDLFERQGDFKQAYNYRKLYSEMKDTLLNEQSSKQLTEMNTKYESEKKDKELIKKDAEITKQQTEAEKQIILRNAFIMGFTLVLILAFFIYRGYRQKQKANKLLDEKNEKITDSINYAKRIQESILPPLEEIKKILPESFILYQPKDIVSGDFYWFHVSEELRIKSEELKVNKNTPLFFVNSANSELRTQNSQLFLAAVDCTGHGVPGAFMSMMGYNLLEQVVKKNHIYQPAMVLNELSKLVVEALRQTNQPGKVNDGMDIALIRLMFNDENSTLEKGNQPPSYYQLEYAGAHNSLYLIRNGVLHETKADKASIGFSLEKSFRFTNHKISLEKGDCLYIFSDGFADQKGGPANEKFYYQPFRELLVEIHQLNMEEQQQKLQHVFSEWKGNRGQIDDMLVIGVRV